MMSRSVRMAALSSAMCIACADAPAQCVSQWLPGPTVPGLSGRLTAMTRWDPDGPGPMTTHLILAGAFATAGTAVAGPFASWDGAVLKNWSAAGFSTCQPPTLLATYGDQLIAGAYRVVHGLYSVPCGGNMLFAWNGASWDALGGGVYGFGGDFQGNSVNAVSTFQGDLIVAGQFTRVGASGPGGLAVRNIARWNGSSWSALGTGLGSNWGGVRALAVYRGQLIAAGYVDDGSEPTLNGVALWDGVSWRPLGGGITGGTVYELFVHDARLIAAGSFTTADGQPAANIARWDGVSWSPLGGGADGSVSALTVYNGQLVAAGQFTSAGGQPTRGIARWNGASWKWFGPGIGVAGAFESVSSLEVYKGLLIAGGTFTAAGGVPARNIAAWNGATATWSALTEGAGALNGDLYAIGAYDGELVGAGHFTTLQGKKTNVVRRDGDSWRPLGSGQVLTGPGQVHWGFGLRVREYRDELILAGRFQRVDGVKAFNIARWNGAAWLPLRMGTNEEVLALEEYQGDLIVAGRFGKVGTPWIPAGRIARWRGDTETWHPLGAGVSGAPWGPPIVNSLAVYQGGLIAAGNFTSAGGQPIGHIARWDGASWSPLGVGLPDAAMALGVFGGELYAPAGVGEFQEYGAVYRWNGTSWWYMLPEFYGVPWLMQPFRGTLHASGGHDASVLRFNGEAWIGLQAGGLGPVTKGVYPGYGLVNFPPQVHSMTVHDDQIYYAGNFSIAGGKPSVGWARWGCACYPDCNNDHTLDGADAACFHERHAAEHPYADCDNDGLHTFADLTCFQLKFAAGCP